MAGRLCRATPNCSIFRARQQRHRESLHSAAACPGLKGIVTVICVKYISKTIAARLCKPAAEHLLPSISVRGKPAAHAATAGSNSPGERDRGRSHLSALWLYRLRLCLVHTTSTERCESLPAARALSADATPGYGLAAAGTGSEGH